MAGCPTPTSTSTRSRPHKIYSPLEERGQQGFPSISGDRLVWQDGVFGGDDIMEVRLPSGL